MNLRRKSSLQERRLRAEVRRILLLLERTRRTCRQAHLLVALTTGVSRRKPGTRPGGIRPRRKLAR